MKQISILFFLIFTAQLAVAQVIFQKQFGDSIIRTVIINNAISLESIKNNKLTQIFLYPDGYRFNIIDMQANNKVLSYIYTQTGRMQLPEKYRVTHIFKTTNIDTAYVEDSAYFTMWGKDSTGKWVGVGSGQVCPEPTVGLYFFYSHLIDGFKSLPELIPYFYDKMPYLIDPYTVYVKPTLAPFKVAYLEEQRPDSIQYVINYLKDKDEIIRFDENGDISYYARTPRLDYGGSDMNRTREVNRLNVERRAKERKEIAELKELKELKERIEREKQQQQPVTPQKNKSKKPKKQKKE